jgi:hypothetical protein
VTRPVEADGLAAVIRSMLGAGEQLVGLWRPALVSAELPARSSHGVPSSLAPMARLSPAAAVWVEAAGILGVTGATSVEGPQALIAMSREAAEALVGASLAIAQAAESPRGVFAPVPVSIWIDGALYRATVLCDTMQLSNGNIGKSIFRLSACEVIDLNRDKS